MYLRQHNGQALSKARLYGIAKEKYVAQTTAYDNTYVTEFDSEVIKHPTLDEYALQMENTNGLPEVFINSLEESLPEGWVTEGGIL